MNHHPNHRKPADCEFSLNLKPKHEPAFLVLNNVEVVVVLKSPESHFGVCISERFSVTAVVEKGQRGSNISKASTAAAQGNI